MKISVIIPVYNAEKYLDNCVQSVLKQSYIDFELLLINDGSTDRSGQICDKYVIDDSRIKVFHKENGGVSSARNLGLEHANGEWITFIDSDDWISENYFSCFEDKVSTEIDWILLNLTKKNIKNIDVEVKFSPDILNRQEFLEKYKVHPHFFGVMAKFFRNASIKLNQIQFEEKLNFGEDNLFNFEYILKIDCIQLKGEGTYFYRETESGLSKGKHNLPNDEVKYFQLYNLLIKGEISETIINKNIGMSVSRYFAAIMDSRLSLKEKYSKSLVLFERHLLIFKEDLKGNRFYQFLLQNKLYFTFIIILQLRKLVK